MKANHSRSQTDGFYNAPEFSCWILTSDSCCSRVFPFPPVCLQSLPHESLRSKNGRLDARLQRPTSFPAASLFFDNRELTNNTRFETFKDSPLLWQKTSVQSATVFQTNSTRENKTNLRQDNRSHRTLISVTFVDSSTRLWAHHHSQRVCFPSWKGIRPFYENPRLSSSFPGQLVEEDELSDFSP